MIYIDTGAFLARHLRKDQHLSFTDCVLLVLMKSKKIKRVFTFDQHFQLAGFQVYPKTQ